MWSKMIEMFKRDYQRMRSLDYRKKSNLVMLIGGLFVIALVIYLPCYYTITPRFCGSCHIMKPYERTWAVSNHRKFFCTTCHVEPGLGNLVTSRLQGVGDAWSMFFGDENQPLRVHKPSNATCMQCHTQNRVASPNGDLLIPHRDHIKLRGVLCVDCHSNMIHKKNAQGNFKPTMDYCFKCHDGNKAPKDCTACHTSMAATRDHRLAGWNKKGHVEKAKTEKATCDRCHEAFPTFCIDCHKKNGIE